MTHPDPLQTPETLDQSSGTASAVPRRGREKSFTKTKGLRVVSRSPAVVADAVLQKAWAGCPVEPIAYRDTFARRFMRLCRAVFRSWQQLAAFLQTDDRTARNYWAGLHKPTGDKVALMALAFPEAFRLHCGAGPDQ